MKKFTAFLIGVVGGFFFSLRKERRPYSSEENVLPEEHEGMQLALNAESHGDGFFLR